MKEINKLIPGDMIIMPKIRGGYVLDAKECLLCLGTCDVGIGRYVEGYRFVGAQGEVEMGKPYLNDNWGVIDVIRNDERLKFFDETEVYNGSNPP